VVRVTDVPLETKEAMKSLKAEIEQIDDQIAALKSKRRHLMDEYASKKFGVNIGDKLRHTKKGTTGVVIGFDGDYWPTIRKLKKDGAESRQEANAYGMDRGEWEVVERCYSP
jgi:transposase